MSNTIEISKKALELTLDSHIQSAKERKNSSILVDQENYWKGYLAAMKFIKKDIKRYQVVSFNTKPKTRAVEP